jgi:hypothetical protein
MITQHKYPTITNSTPCADVASKEPEVQQMLRRANEAVESLHKTTSFLMERLNPVCEPQVPSPVSENCKSCPPSCELGGKIATLADSIHVAEQFLQSMIDRLQV